MPSKIVMLAACSAMALPIAITAPAAAADTTPVPEATTTAPATDPAPDNPAPEDPPTAVTQPAPTSTQAPIDPQASSEAQPLGPTSVPATTAPKSTKGDTMKPRKRVPDRASRGAVLRTRGVRYSPLVAVQRLLTWAKQGRSGYRNQCLRLVDDAYGAPGHGRTGTALRQWYRAKRAGYAHFDRNAPIGAQLFWRTSNPAGHIATYVGNGKVVTNVGNGKVRLRSWSSIDRWGPYLGWAEPFYS